MDTFRKFTECINPKDFAGIPYNFGLIGVLVAAVLFALLGLTNLVTVPIAIAAVILLIAGAHYYLYQRLLCLGGGIQTAIGVVNAVTRASIGRTLFDKFGDDDATMGIFLSPGPTDFDSDPDVYWNTSQGFLIKPNDAVVNVGLSYPTSGKDLRYVKHLHCEFEGSGIYEFLQWLKLVLAILLAILALLLLAPGLSDLLILFLKLLALLFGGFGLANFFLPGVEGDPTDVNPDLKDLKKGDIVMVSGDWIYDSGHAGWNEIHAVHACQRLSGSDGVILAKLNPDGTWPDDIGGGLGLDPAHLPVTLAGWKAAIADATTAINGGSQADPANNWILHPTIDGCKSTIIL